MLSLLESLEIQIVYIWTICFLFGFYFSLEESH